MLLVDVEDEGVLEPDELAPSRLSGTFTMYASSRLVPPFDVQMKYSPVISRLPFGYFQYISPSVPPLPDAFTSVSVGATISVSREPSSLKQTTSLMRAAVAPLPLLAHATC